MSKRNIKFDLDFEQKDILPKFAIKQFDNALISVSTFSKGEPLNPVGNSCKLYVSAGNDVFLQESNIRTLENLVEIDLDKNVVSLDGKAFGELELTDRNGVFTSATFIFNIDSKVGEGSTLPGGIEGFIAKHERLIREFKEEINPKIEEINNSIKEEINPKIEEINNSIKEEINPKIEEIDNSINNAGVKNAEQDNRLNKLEYKNKVQDTFLNGLFNENKDGRLSINGEGNSLKLEGSKEGIVEVESIEGNTFSSIFSSKEISVTSSDTVQTTRMDLKYTIPSGGKVTLAYTVDQVDGTGFYLRGYLGGGGNTAIVYVGVSEVGTRVIKEITVTDSFNGMDNLRLVSNASESGGKVAKISDVIIVPGAKSDNELLLNSEYFENMKSSFEEHKITEDDVREGLELQDNLGKYRCNVKVIGKNIVNPKELNIVKKWQCESKILEDYGIEIKPTSTEGVSFIRLSKVLIPKGKVFKLSTKHSGNKSNTFIWESGDLGTTNPVDISNPSSVDRYVDLGLYVDNSSLSNKVVYYVQIEEVESAGSPTTEYEPYYETNQVVYLNNPLLKGDKIVYKEDGLYHCHTREQFILDENLSWNLDSNTLEKTNRFNVLKCLPKADLSTNIQVISTYLTSKDTTYNKDVENIQIIDKGTVYIRIDKTKATNVEALKTYLKQNPIPIIYGLKEPTYEKILDSKFIVDIPNNATLSVESVVPCKYIKVSYTGNVPSVYGIEDSISDIENHNLEMVATTFDMDYRLLEVEWALEDAGIVGINLNILNKAGGNTMALSRYEQAKIMIIGGAYDKATLTKQLTRYLEKDIITKEEYDELIALMEAKELVTGEELSSFFIQKFKEVRYEFI